MELILKAMKAIFRKVEAALNALDERFGDELSSVQNAVNTADATAKTAMDTASSALETAKTANATATTAAKNASAAKNLAEGKMAKFYPTGEGALRMEAREGSLMSPGITILGYDSYVSSNYSSAIGMQCEATGNHSFAIGSIAKATGQYSHALGRLAKANGEGASAIGLQVEANGYCSHAEGFNSVASGDYSHAEGCYTLASSECQHVQGKYNVADTESKFAHIVGNGRSNSIRSNAHTLDWDGNAWFAGTVEGTAMILTSPGGKRFKVTVDDSGTLSAAEVTE